MQRTRFRVLILAMLLTGAWIARHQHLAIATARLASANPMVGASSSHTGPSTSVGAQPPRKAPSLELLKLRAEVSRAREELDTDPVRARAISRAVDEWALVFAGVRPSQQPGFVAFDNLPRAGNLTPSAGFAAFHRVMRNQSHEPLTQTRMKEIWSVPDDFDDPSVRYSIHLGRGIGPETGYRIVAEKRIAADQVTLVLDYENPDGSSFRGEATLEETDGRWRMKPQKVVRMPDPDPAPQPSDQAREP